MKKLLGTKPAAIDFALLVLRLGLGAMFILHGEGKMFGGPDVWEKVGGSMKNLGIDYAPVFWGFMAAFAEFGGGILLILGFLTRPACFLMLFTMTVAAIHHLHPDEGLKATINELIDPKTTLDKIMEASHAIEAGCTFFALMLIGAGKFSLDKKFFG